MCCQNPKSMHGCFTSIKCSLSSSDLSHAFAGYFYWWVIVSISWGLIASVIAIVLPVWEVRFHLHPVRFPPAQLPLSRPKHHSVLCRGLTCALHPVQARATIGAIIVHMLRCQSARPLHTALKKVSSYPLGALAMTSCPHMHAMMHGGWACHVDGRLVG